jgi:hypothetical protein
MFHLYQPFQLLDQSILHVLTTVHLRSLLALQQPNDAVVAEQQLSIILQGDQRHGLKP